MNKAILFVAGAVAGSLVTWKLVEAKYKQIAEEEIASVVEHYKNKEQLMHDLELNEEKNITEETTTAYNNLVADLEYVSDEATVIVESNEEQFEPYVISPEEFGEKEGYDTKSWTYYADLVLADEDDDKVIEPESIIGDGLNHFGDFEDDSVYIRNDNNECDYEILKSERTFSEISGEAI
jgi:hypothetical protein